jgi:hypothetical protein
MLATESAGLTATQGRTICCCCLHRGTSLSRTAAIFRADPLFRAAAPNVQYHHIAPATRRGGFSGTPERPPEPFPALNTIAGR